MGEVWSFGSDFRPLPREDNEPGVGETLRTLDQISQYYPGAMAALARLPKIESPPEPETTDPATS